MCNSCDGIKITKSQEDFIGSAFPTPKGGVLTVTGIKGKYSRGTTLFKCVCSICNKDIELFPDEFMITKSNLVRGFCPCGCAKSCRWTESQNKVRVQRECDKRGYIFHGWYGGYQDSKTYLDLENPETCNRWHTTSLNNFFGGKGDPTEWCLEGKVKAPSPKKDSLHIQDFYKAGFTKDYKFWRSDRLCSRGRKPYWRYACLICSNDEYVQNGLCSGVFESFADSLKRGDKSCRCSPSYRWTQEQREYQINKICNKEELTFLGWETKECYKNQRSKFKWVCKEGHECNTSVNNFLNGNRCKTCSDIKQRESGNYNGYYPERKDDTDFLYIINFNNEYIKVGRAFDIDKRIHNSGKGLLKLSGMSLDQLALLKVFTSTHQEVYDCEQWVHEELTDRGFYHEDSTWTIETFDVDSEQIIYKLLESSDLVETKSPY